MKALRRQFFDERGVTLIVAMGVLAVITGISVSMIAFSSSNSRHADYSAENTKAQYHAEAGMNYARSILWSASDPEDPSSVGTGTISLDGGDATYSASYDTLTSTWTLIGTGTVPNPSGGPDVARTVSSKVAVIASGVPAVWEGNFSDDTASCMQWSQNVVFPAPLYARGSVCMGNGSLFAGSSLHVGGTLTVGNNASVGTGASPIPAVNVTGGCTGGAPDPHPCLNGPADDVYDQDAVITQDPNTLTKPTADFPYWYQNASPGPMSSCTVGSMPGGFDNDALLNWSRSDFDLTPNSPYTCETSSGKLNWTPGNPGILEVDGVVFFDGTILVSDNNAVYQGQGVIYSSGWVKLKISAHLCGVTACDATWDSATNVLVFVAGGSDVNGNSFEIDNKAVFQGAAYAVGGYKLNQNAQNWGPVVADKFKVENNAGQYVPLLDLPPGTPGEGKTLVNVAGSYSSS